MDKNLEIRIELEILITEREAMIAANTQREAMLRAPAYGEEYFDIIAQKMAELLPPNKGDTK